MARSNAHENAFTQEKENQQQIYSIISRLIFNISKSVVPSLRRAGMTDEQVQPVLDNLSLNQGKIESLKTTLARKKMKVVMFGETSSGKSMVINAMLGKDLLVCGIGDATNCFITIEQKEVDDGLRSQGSGCRPPSYCESESKFTIRRSSFAQCQRREQGRATGYDKYRENGKYPLNVKALHELSDGSAAEPLDVSFNIEVSLAAYDHRCSLLSKHLQIVDCPGVSTSKQLGNHVKDFCGDADLHVLIVDSMVGITVQGMDHFMKVKDRLPNPDIIIAFTQWDRSANETQERKNRVRQKHLKNAFKLLQATGTVSNMDEATERCFFISGKEALDNALGEQVKYVQDQQERAKAFSDFMRKIEERASIAGKKAKLNFNLQCCRDILTSCTDDINTLRAWISLTTNELVIETDQLRDTIREIDRRTRLYMGKNKEQRERALTEVEEALMDCMDAVIRKLRDTLAKKTKEIKAFDFHEHGETVVLHWYANILRSSQRTTTMVCNEYSRDLLREYKECFQEFPHEHPKAFADALNDEILQVNSSNSEPSKSKVDSLLRGVTDKGLVAMFATTRKRMSDVEGQNRESQRMAAGASILFLRVRRWLMATVDSQLLDRFEDERKHGLEEIRESCRYAVEQFCDSTDAYYYTHIANALRKTYQKELENRKQKIKHLRDTAQLLNDLRNEAEGFLLHHTYDYVGKTYKGL